MNPDTYDINVSVNDQYITLKWVRRASEQVADMLAFYPELQLEFRYDDISFDTVKAMLKGFACARASSARHHDTRHRERQLT